MCNCLTARAVSGLQGGLEPACGAGDPGGAGPGDCGQVVGEGGGRNFLPGTPRQGLAQEAAVVANYPGARLVRLGEAQFLLPGLIDTHIHAR